MRISYSDDEERPGQFALWDANCERSLRGKRGQQALRDLEAALLALPDKRLIADAVHDETGGVCALGAYGRHKGIDLSKFPNDYDSDEIGIAGGMPRLVAWTIVALNDIELDGYYLYMEGPRPMQTLYGGYYGGGWSERRRYTPEERYERVLAWIRERLKPAEAAHG